MKARVVVHCLDGSLKKGVSSDLRHERGRFHLEENVSGKLHEISFAETKAVFFVKSFDGSPEYNESKDSKRAGYGRGIKIRFMDGEIIVGYTSTFSTAKEVFFIFPCDPESNNERILINRAATVEIIFPYEITPAEEEQYK